MTLLLRTLRQLYAAFLWLLPAELRSEHGPEMRATSDRLVADALRRRGMLAALAAAGRECSDVLQAAAHASRRAPGELQQDVVHAWRLMWARPGFTLTILATLAIGIGSTTTVFTVVNTLLLRPLPYTDPERLVLLVGSSGHGEQLATSPRDFEDMVAAMPSIASAAAYTDEQVNLTGGAEPERADAALVTPNFFDVVGAPLRHGRGFTAADGTAGESVAVISDALWQRRFGGRAAALGERIAIDGVPHAIVGVAAAAMTFPGRPQVWRPLAFTPDQLDPSQRGARWITAIARLKPGASVATAAAEARQVAGRLAVEYPRTNRGRSATVRPLQAHLVGGTRTGVLALFAAVTLVLLIACANVANLLLARASARSAEMALRMALGATRARVLRQCVAENLLLTTLAAAAGLALAAWGTRAVIGVLPAALPRAEEIAVDWVAAAFACAAALVLALVLGTTAVLGMRTGLSAPGARITRGGANGIRRGLVVAEVAMAVVLLAGAGLFVRSLANLNSVAPGFDPANVLTFSVTMPEAAYGDPDRLIAFVRRLESELNALPNAVSAAGIFGLPLTHEFGAGSSFVRMGRDTNPEDEPMAALRVSTPGYFATMGIPLAAGRDFTDRDTRVAPGVAIVNEAAARRYWPGENPIGQSLRLGVGLSAIAQTPREIVGIAKDVRYAGLDVPPQPEVYIPHAQHPVDGLVFAVRTANHPRRIVPEVRAALRRLDPNLPMSRIATMGDIVGESVAARRFSLYLLAGFAATALLLGALGVYGVLSYTVTLRTREIGVRMAMGARRRHVLGLVAAESTVLVGAGLGLGLALAAAGAGLIRGLLYEVQPLDASTFIAVSGILVAVAAAASGVPALRAAAIDPTAALRSE